ncbi:hypothetical protein NDU88_004966 [Pleurodeles waltl]|uniref:Uncharacterized protein n=1 Tax=Pleurodeles waltl TaxID=8319 RepID=A0AAV7UH86_PLEWA|nr:hypothetical protein NDU88_004966 [Pleurodeles waltl]
MNTPMQPLGVTGNGPRGAAQKRLGRRQAGEHGEGAAAPHLELRERLHSRPLLRQSRKARKVQRHPQRSCGTHLASREMTRIPSLRCCTPPP